jgi:hypothetical protein
MVFGRKFGVEFGRAAVVLVLGLAITGCSRLDIDSFKAPKLSDGFRGLSVTSAPVGTLGPRGRRI